MKYYALRCNQNDNLMYTGLNTTSKESLRKELLSYISIDFDANDEDWVRMEKMSVDEIAKYWDFTILEMNERFVKCK